MNKRQTQILELLTQNKKIEVTKLSELLGVSQVTIRKDLDALAESGMLVREHGYATLNKSDDMNIRLAYHYEQKQKVAKKAGASAGEFTTTSSTTTPSTPSTSIMANPSTGDSGSAMG